MGRGLAIQNPLYGYEIDIQHLKNLIFPQLGMTTIAMMMTRMEAWVGGNSNVGAGARWSVGWRLSARLRRRRILRFSSVRAQGRRESHHIETQVFCNQQKLIYSIPILIQAPKTFSSVSPQLAQRGGGSHNMGVTQLALTGDRQTHLSQKVHGDLEI